MRRVVVNGISGSGKTTVARQLAHRLGVPYVELDALHHGPGWREATSDELQAKVRPLVEGDVWVVDGNYHGKLGDLVLARADTVVWLELPLALTLARLIRRTLSRLLRREELWNGNRESLRGGFVGRESVVVWAIRRRVAHRRELPEHYARHPHLTVLRLRSRRDVAELLARATPGSGG